MPYRLKEIGLYLNGEELMSAVIYEKISNGSISTVANYSFEEAQELAVQLEAGAFPLKLTQQEMGNIE